MPENEQAVPEQAGPGEGSVAADSESNLPPAGQFLPATIHYAVTGDPQKVTVELDIEVKGTIYRHGGQINLQSDAGRKFLALIRRFAGLSDSEPDLALDGERVSVKGKHATEGGRLSWVIQEIGSVPEPKPDGNFTPGSTATSRSPSNPSSSPNIPITSNGPSQATAIVRLAGAVELFHTADGQAFASFDVRGHREIWRLRDKAFRDWLARLYYQMRGAVPSTHALTDALAVLEGRAMYGGSEQPVFVRLAERDGRIYLDLANDNWEVVEITPEGWRVGFNPPVKFRRTAGLKPLPHPVRGGSIEALRRFVNVADGADWMLAVAWLVAAFKPKGPYPVLVIYGPQGCAKSTTTRALRWIVDPNTADLRALPKNVRAIMISAHNSWCLAFDNLSRLKRHLSDALCCLATGAGLAHRELYTDDGERLFEAARPIILNGISLPISRPDLIDRSLIIEAPTIDDHVSEAEFYAKLEEARPYILGALLDAVSGALQRLPEVTAKLRDDLPRMADFALWVTAAEPALGWSDGSFLRTYTGNRFEANTLALDASPIYYALKELVGQGPWCGTPTDLLAELARCRDTLGTCPEGWPEKPRRLSDMLRALVPCLQMAGVEVSFAKTSGSGSKRVIKIRSRKKAATDAATILATEATDAEAPENAVCVDCVAGDDDCPDSRVEGVL